MKRFFVFLAVLAVALLVLYIWWQVKATEVITAQVKSMAHGFFSNSGDLHVELDQKMPVKMVGLREARVPKLVIYGTNLVTREGMKIASARVALKDLDVAGPPFHFTNVASGYYSVTVTDKAVTDYLRKRGIALGSIAKIPLDTLNVSFSQKDGTMLRGDAVVNLAIVKKHVPLVVQGKLVPSSKVGQVDFQVRSVQLLGWSVGEKHVTDSLGALNPVIDMSDWPLMSDIKLVSTGNGTVKFNGKVTGVR